MPTYRPHTPVASLATNANGDRTILEQHIDENLDRLMDQIELALRTAISQGGVLDAGTVTIEASTTVRVQNRSGITQDARAAVIVGDQSADMSALADGILYRAVITAEGAVFTTFNFTDPETGEALSHNLMAYLGKLTILTGDATNYPDIPANALPVAKLSKAAGVVTIDEQEDTPPAYPGDGSVRVSANDTTARPLTLKLVAGTGITLTEQNDAGDETLQIAASGGAGGGDVTAAGNNTFTGENVFTTPTNTTDRSLIGQGAAVTDVGLYAKPSAAINTGARYFTLAAEAVSAQAAAASTGHVVAMYGAAESDTPDARIWASNFLAKATAGMISGDVQGIEVDVNNEAGDSLTPASALKVWGITVSGFGANRRISPFSVQGPASGWNYGLTFYNDVLQGGQAYVYSEDANYPARGIDFSSGVFSDAAVKLASGIWKGGGSTLGVGTATPDGNATLHLAQTNRATLTFQSAGSTPRSRLQQHANNGTLNILDNAYYDGIAWQRDDIGLPSIRTFFDAANPSVSFSVQRSAAGSGSISFSPLFRATAGAGAIIGNTALPTGATDGFLWVPTMAGAPTGTPGAWGDTAPIVVDSSNSRIYAYVGGTWKSAAIA